MGPRGRTRQEIIDLLGRAAEQAQYAEDYHAAAEDPGALKGRAAHQAARDAAAMQLIELAGCAEGFIRDRGDPGTTLERLDRALRPVFDMRLAHTHPERVAVPPPITPRQLGDMIKEVRKAIGNLDGDTLRIQSRDQERALNGIHFGVTQIEKDGLPDPEALRPRDLHYAGYYREIQFARLAKETGLYANWNSGDARHVDVNRSIFDADDMAHKFHLMRGDADKNILPVSVVGPTHRDRVPGRSLSGLMRELRHDFQRPAERLAEREISATETAREQYRDAVRGLAQQYARMTADPEAAILIHDYVQRQHPPLDREIIDAMRKALQVAAAPGGGYLALPKSVRQRCDQLCLVLDHQGDGRLLGILDAAEGRGGVGGLVGRDQDLANMPGGATGNAPEHERAGQTGATEQDPYLAAFLAEQEAELSPVKEGPEREATDEQSPTRGRSR
jgi:hypothetical protein